MTAFTFSRISPGALITHRWAERLLLLPAGAFLVVGARALERSEAGAPPDIWQMVTIFCVAFLLAHLAVTLLTPNADQVLLPITAMLSAIGLLFVARLEPDFVAKQVSWYGIGIAVMIGVLVFLPDPRALRSYKYIAASAGLALMVVTAVVGQEINGSRLWLGVGGFNFQVTEAMKLLLVIFLAGYLADRRLILGSVTRRWRAVRVPTLPYLIPLGVIWVLTFLVLIWQRDLGAVLLLGGVTLLLLYAATNRIGFIVIGVALVILNVFVAYHQFDYVRVRIDVWLHPLSDATGGGYQLAQSLYALAHGGMLGAGLGSGFPEYIPAVHTDFVFAAVAEELGVAGAIGLIALYLLFAARGLRIALLQLNDFGTLLALGLTGILALQSIIIIAGNLSLIPITGITMPFVSYGGSSILVNFVMLAILMRLSAMAPRT
ncbi:MAG: FtsW/RodA/SpoVE family cell cycle protein [Dehalococcoidia bacterium]